MSWHFWWVLLVGLGLVFCNCQESCTVPDANSPNPYALSSDNEEETNDIALDCDFYIAESTILGAGLGLFTARSWNEGDSMKNNEVMIPLLELHRHHRGMDEKIFFHTMHDYSWKGETSGVGSEVETTDLEAFWPGIGAAINFNPALENIEVPGYSYKEAGIHRFTHPGAGAFTPYQGGTAKALREIPVGCELFLNYGSDSWFTTRVGYEEIATMESYQKAEELLDNFEQYFVGNEDFSFLHKDEEFYALIKTLVSTWDTRMHNALPKTYSDAQFAMAKNEIAILHQPKSTRSVSWLQEHGKCIDHIGSGRSTIENAGSGAFARRRLPQGTIVTGSPLLKYFRNLTNMYELKNEEDVELEGQITGQQLLLNYCFGNEESNLLLCPYGSGVNFINHNQTLANLEIRWATHGSTAHNSTWLTMDPGEMGWNFKTKLAFDYVAIKDIEEGAELFLDYGDAWENAWSEHVRKWNPPNEWSSYTSAAQWDAKSMQENEPLRTEEEQVDFPYPANLRLYCHVELKNENKEFDYYLEDLGINLWEAGEFDWREPPAGLPCTVVSRSKGKSVGDRPIWYYDVEFTYEDADHLRFNVVRTDVPRRAIRFVDAPYTTDMHLNSAFRHEIGIPEKIFPAHWKDQILQH